MAWAKKTFPILSAILIAYFPWQTYSQIAQNNTGRSESELFVLSATGKHKFKVEIAKTPREQKIGLIKQENILAFQLWIDAQIVNPENWLIKK